MKNKFDGINIEKTEIKLGLPAPVKLLHITDTHIAYDDPGNNCERWKCFEGDAPGRSADYFEQSLEYARENNIPVLHTGDLIDFISEANYAYVDKTLAGVDYMYAAGNHDFCHCVGQAKEDEPYKWHYMKRTAPHFAPNLLFDSRVIGGVNIVTMDDSYYLISDGQTQLLRAEAAKGYPIVLCMHVPLFAKELADHVISKGNPCAYLTCPPEDYLSRYSEERRIQQTPDEVTKRAVEYIKSEPLIKLIVAGHVHDPFDCVLDNGVMQLVSGAGYRGYAREITLI